MRREVDTHDPGDFDAHVAISGSPRWYAHAVVAPVANIRNLELHKPPAHGLPRNDNPQAKGLRVRKLDLQRTRASVLCEESLRGPDIGCEGSCEVRSYLAWGAG